MKQLDAREARRRVRQVAGHAEMSRKIDPALLIAILDILARVITFSLDKIATPDGRPTKVRWWEPWKWMPIAVFALEIFSEVVKLFKRS